MGAQIMAILQQKQSKRVRKIVIQLEDVMK